MIQSAAHDGEWPEGDLIRLNARRLTKLMLRQIGEALGVPSSSSVTCAELRLMMEGKLTGLGYDPSNLHVILSNDVNGVMYLANDEGIIKCVTAHVSDDSRDNLCSALCIVTQELEKLCTLLESKEEKILSLKAELAEACATIE